jgi:hypothetical protein
VLPFSHILAENERNVRGRDADKGHAAVKAASPSSTYSTCRSSSLQGVLPPWALAANLAARDMQPGAAPITLARFTHMLPGDSERARGQLDAFLAESIKAAADRRP